MKKTAPLTILLPTDFFVFDQIIIQTPFDKDINKWKMQFDMPRNTISGQYV